MTKPCKSCQEQIDVAATKCPRCQAYQGWYRNPQWLSFVFLLLFFAFIWSRPGLTGRTRFPAYKDKLSVSIVREDQSARGREHLLTVRLENRSDKTWKHPKFQVESLDGNGKVICVEHLSDYNLVVAPNSSTLDTLSLRVEPAEPVVNRKITVTDIDSNPY